MLPKLLVALASTSAFAETPQGTLYKAQQCDCCEAHAEYLRTNGGVSAPYCSDAYRQRACQARRPFARLFDAPARHTRRCRDEADVRVRRRHVSYMDFLR